MNSVFGRALLGFIVTTFVVISLVGISMWGIEKFGGDVWWAQLLVMIVGLVSTISLYGTFLHEPLKRWVDEPEFRKKHEITDSWIRSRVDEEFGKLAKGWDLPKPSKQR